MLPVVNRRCGTKKTRGTRSATRRPRRPEDRKIKKTRATRKTRRSREPMGRNKACMRKHKATNDGVPAPPPKPQSVSSFAVLGCTEPRRAEKRELSERLVLRLSCFSVCFRAEDALGINNYPELQVKNSALQKGFKKTRARTCG